MVKKQKRVDREDKWYVLAKEQGYRSRAAFKLSQINKEFGILNGQTRVVLDLCAAPGGWAQVAAKCVSSDAAIIAVDLLAIRPIPNVRTIIGDITTQETRVAVRREAQKVLAKDEIVVDVALCDGAPNVGAAYARDAFVQNEISLAALKCAVECGLKRNGAFVTKVYRGRDYNALLWAFGRLFERVRAFKPAASRNQSAEIFVVCQNFLAPIKIDPRLLDPKCVFAEIMQPTDASSNLSVLHPKWGAKRRQRQGYADDAGALLVLPKGRVSDFISASDPGQYLADHSSLDLDNDDDNHDYIMSEELIECCKDLKLLARTEMRHLLKWREKYISRKKKAVVAQAHDSTSDEEDSASEEIDDEERVTQDLSRAQTLAALEARREKKRGRRKEAKLRLRRAAGIVEASNVDLEGNARPVFSAADAELIGGLDALEDASLPEEETPEAKVNARYTEYASVRDRDAAVEDDLDEAYRAFADRRATRSGQGLTERLIRRETRDARAAAQLEEDIALLDPNLDDYVQTLARHDASSASSSDEDEAASSAGGADDHQEEEEDQVTSRWFSKPIFDQLPEMPETEKEMRKRKRKKAAERNERRLQRQRGDDEEHADIEVVQSQHEDFDGGDEAAKTKTKSDEAKALLRKGLGALAPSHGTDKDDGFQIVPTPVEAGLRTYDEKDEIEPSIHDKAETMALATMMLRKSKAKQLVDASYNRYAWNDPRDLPEWFLDDEKRHYRPQLPIRPELVAEMKLKFQALSARPAKRVAEARARKKKRADLRLAAAKRKAESVANDPDMTPNQKLRAVEKAMAKGARANKIDKPSKIYVVQRKSKAGAIAKKAKSPGAGKNSRIVMVDKRLKKDKRATKANAKRKKKSASSSSSAKKQRRH